MNSPAFAPDGLSRARVDSKTLVEARADALAWWPQGNNEAASLRELETLAAEVFGYALQSAPGDLSSDARRGRAWLAARRGPPLGCALAFNTESLVAFAMAAATPATLALKKLGIAFELRSYDYDPNAASVGLHAAESLGEPPSRVLKTLIVQVDGKPACVVLPSDREASMKKVATAFGGKSAAMMPVADAERLTGYKVGGVSPFGQRRQLRTVVEAAVATEVYVYVNGGQRGLQIRLGPADLLSASGARAASIAV